MLSSILPFATLLALTASNPLPLPSPNGVPITIRECFISTLTPFLFPPFASHLETQPTTTVPKNMGMIRLQYTVNGTCLEAQVYNWSCDHDLSITGPNLANAVSSIADQCEGRKYSSGETAGPVGFGYYQEMDTGYEFTKHLWVVTGECRAGRLQSACSPGA